MVYRSSWNGSYEIPVDVKWLLLNTFVYYACMCVCAFLFNATCDSYRNRKTRLFVNYFDKKNVSSIFSSQQWTIFEKSCDFKSLDAMCQFFFFEFLSEGIGVISVTWCYVILASNSFVKKNTETRQTICLYRNIEALSLKYSRRGKSSKYCIFFDCVSLDIGMQHAQRMRHIILSSLAFLTVPYSFTVSHYRYEFRTKNVVELKMCFDF
jgi:hypothetical protein